MHNLITSAEVNTMNYFMKTLTYGRWIQLSPKLFLSLEPHSFKKSRAESHTRQPFVNIKRVFVRAGSGGDGCIAFERLFCNANAGPSGGNGGNGAHVILRASKTTTDLSHIPSIIQGSNGGRGHGSHCHGANAEHMYIQVPIGTQVFPLSPDGLPSSEPVVALHTDGDIYLAARGGAGGKSNAFLTNAAAVNSASIGPVRPGFHGNNPLRIAERGARGEEARLLLRMANLAQLGLVGAPNAGKSTLLRRLTRARPKVAPYPFTTMKPHIGILSLPGTPESEGELHFQDTPLTVADLPGILPGAAEFNTGLGAEFLSLITDCQSLAYVIDMGSPWTQLNLTAQSDEAQTVLLPVLTQQLAHLKHELVTFDRNLGDPHRCLVVGTKLDMIFPHHQLPVDQPGWSSSPACAQFSQLSDLLARAAAQAGILDGRPESSWHDAVVLVSARRGDNIQQLIDIIARQAVYRDSHSVE